MRFTALSAPPAITVMGSSRVPATTTTPGMVAFTASISSSVNSWLIGWVLSGVLIISAQTRFEPTLSIWEITNFLLVSATVTTSTIEALPMITPREVSMARILLARRASTATENVSRKSIMRFHQNSEKTCSTGILTFGGALILLRPFQAFARELILGIEFHGLLILRLRGFALILLLE